MRYVVIYLVWSMLQGIYHIPVQIVFFTLPSSSFPESCLAEAEKRLKNEIIE